MFYSRQSTSYILNAFRSHKLFCVTRFRYERRRRRRIRLVRSRPCDSFSNRRNGALRVGLHGGPACATSYATAMHNTLQ